MTLQCRHAFKDAVNLQEVLEETKDKPREEFASQANESLGEPLRGLARGSQRRTSFRTEEVFAWQSRRRNEQVEHLLLFAVDPLPPPSQDVTD